MADLRTVSSLPLARSVIDTLLKGGFRLVSDLKSIQPLELAQEIGVAPDVALSIIQCAESSFLTPGSSEKLQFSAKDLLTKSEMSRPIISFCKAMDVMLGGGIQIGQITEFCGVPGVGKTQLGIQLAINVQIPELFNGIGGEAIYIDTEGSFMVERVAEMAREVSIHLGKIAKSTANKMNQQGQSGGDNAAAHMLTHLAAAENMTMERFLEGIHVFRAHDQSETIATINHLPAYLRVKTKIKLIVIDSIAFHFRQDLDDTVSRSRVLSALAQTLNQVAFDHNVAVVMINHVTTRFEGSGARDGNRMDINRLVPALGEQWSHCITNRVMLAWDDSFQRQAVLTKSPTMPPNTAHYCVCQRGIRDVSAEVQAEIADRKRKVSDMSQG